MLAKTACKSWIDGDEEALSLRPRSLAPSTFADLAGFEAFVEACDGARSVASVQRLFIRAALQCGVERVALTTHAPPADLGRLGIVAHNWSERAIAHLYAWPARRANPLFEHAERGDGPVYWAAPQFRTALVHEEVVWLERLSALGVKGGVTQRIRTAMMPASCSATPAWGQFDPAAVRRVMHMAAYAFDTMIALQRPEPAAADLLTLRERQCLALAMFSGLRPREVATALGLSINTVRSIRQSASARLGARSQEEAVWRMVESGQLFHRGRSGRPRA